MPSTLSVPRLSDTAADWATGTVAIDGVVLWQVSFWDALILAVAGRASCSVVYSEDLNAGQRYGGVEVKNPFAEATA